MTATLLYDNLNIYVYLALFLLCAGILGILYRRTLIGMLISLELITNGAGLNFVAFNRFSRTGRYVGPGFYPVYHGYRCRGSGHRPGCHHFDLQAVPAY